MGIEINAAVIFSIIGLIACVGFSLYSPSKTKKLNKIKSKEVGDGQHGTDRFMTINEAKQFYKTVKIPEKFVDMSNEWSWGRIINFNPKTKEALIDTSYTHTKLTAPTESRKTTSYVIPNIQYNLMAGTSMIIPDMKGELYRLTAGDAKRLGYKVCKIDFTDISNSYNFDYFSDINEYIEHYLVHNDLESKAAAEDATGELASTIVHSRKRSDSENTFFLGASEGVIHAISLLVSMFGKKSQKHLSSVNNIVQEMLQTPKTKKDMTPQIIKLINPLPSDFGAKKNLGAAFAAAMETESNIYASVLGDLRPFVNSLGEQIIAHPENDFNFDYKDLISKKTILYIIMPEHKPQFRVFGQTIITKIYNQLAEYASHHNGKLPRPIYLSWEEFGLYERIEGVKDWLAYSRGMGLLIDLIYQANSQIKEKYGDNIEQIISSQCANSIYLGLGPEDTDIADIISKSLGIKTIQTGTINRNYNNNNSLFASATTSEGDSMMERPLMFPSEVLHMDIFNIKLLLRRGKYPFKCSFTSYFENEWPLKPGEPLQERIPLVNNPVDMMTYSELYEAINKYAHRSEEQQAVIYEQENIIKQPDIHSLIHKKLFNITQDPYVLELLEQKKYNDFFKYMDQYKDQISRYELNNLIQPLIERSN